MSVNVSRGVLVVSLMMVLGGCNAGSMGSGLGLSPTEPAAQPATQTAAAVQPFVQGFCPQISLRDGTSVYRTYAKSKSQDAKDVVFQASLADTTRACSRTDTTLTITALLQGRLTSGPQGKAGSINLPIRVTVMDGDQEVTSEIEQYAVNLADVNQPTQFVYTKQVTVPGNVSGVTRVYVGFDEGKKKK
ncbi:hypothetical protein [Rhizobium sp. AG855]|uniref:hypothetical protein n=1 Tax=Rhizobium sp. AG855 TaxID=2183898 RepID=UPI000E74818C|nr:hypothetical protein [Rhizobium sp. AG855]RKE85793.1 hypothetical protein DFO46_2596 [Rhizobium sp. AG855]